MKKYMVVMTNGNKNLALFRVHKFGCQKIGLEIKQTHGHSWDIEAASPEAVIVQLKLDQEADSNPFADDEYEAVDCTKGGH